MSSVQAKLLALDQKVYDHVRGLCNHYALSNYIFKRTGPKQYLLLNEARQRALNGTVTTSTLRGLCDAFKVNTLIDVSVASSKREKRNKP